LLSGFIFSNLASNCMAMFGAITDSVPSAN